MRDGFKKEEKKRERKKEGKKYNQSPEIKNGNTFFMEFEIKIVFCRKN